MKKQKSKLSAELQAIVAWETDNKVASLSVAASEENDDESESYFGQCEISGERGNVWDCEFFVYNDDGSVNTDESYTATISHEALCYFANGID